MDRTGLIDPCVANCKAPTRVHALQRYGILDTPPEKDFDDLCRLAARLCDAPLAALNFIDDEREWFKAEIGFGVREIPLGSSPCMHALLEDETLVVPDTLEDARFANHPNFASGPKLRFYAGAVIRSPDGFALGTVCVLDHRPRQLTPEQLDDLRVVARQVVTLLELRRQTAEAHQLATMRGRISVLLASAEPLAVILARCTQLLVEQLDGAFARIWTLDEAEETLVLQASAGCYTHLDGPHGRVRVGEFKIGRIARDRKALLTNDVPNDPNIGDPAWAQREGMVAFAGYPLLVDGRVVGVMAIFWRQKVSGAILDDLAPIADNVAQCVERKTVEGALAQLSEQRRLALDSARLGWWHFDPVTRMVDWDEQSSALYHSERRRIHADEIVALIHPDDVEARNAAFRDALLADDGVPRYEVAYRVKGRDGFWCWLEIKGKGTVTGIGEERRVTSLDGTIADVTAAKTAQEALRKSEAKFRQLADAMPQIVWTAQSDGHVDHWNHQWYAYTGTRPGIFGDASWRDIVHPESAALIAREWTQSVATGEPYEQEIKIRDETDGTYRWFLSRATPIKDAEGRIVRWIGTSTDVHEQKQLSEQNNHLLESERAARAQAERTSQMKDEFLATLSHELRTPLNAILGWTQVLRGDPGNVEDVKDGLATIERNAKAQTQIIEDLLDMSKIISGKVRLDVQPLHLDQVISAAVDTMRPAATAKNIRLQALVDPQARMISGDPNRLQQVFWNLLTNAIKFTPKGGKVQVVLERVHSHLEVCVADTGEGIAPEFLPYVFDRFRQQDASTTRKHGGLGLGLAIVKQLVDLHGGSIRAESAGPGQGTTFRLMLPLSAVQPALEQTAPERRHPQGGEDAELSIPAELLDLAGLKVLVVDDEPDARTLIKRLLEDRKVSVWLAGSAAEALAILQAERPDVLVSDIGMPEEDGYSLIRRIRALKAEEGGSTPAIALTAYARAEDRLKAILAGFQIHISKPVNTVELLALVATLAGRVRA